jgi:hypothetical protein
MSTSQRPIGGCVAHRGATGSGPHFWAASAADRQISSEQMSRNCRLQPIMHSRRGKRPTFGPVEDPGRKVVGTCRLNPKAPPQKTSLEDPIPLGSSTVAGDQAFDSSGRAVRRRTWLETTWRVRGLQNSTASTTHHLCATARLSLVMPNLA